MPYPGIVSNTEPWVYINAYLSGAPFSRWRLYDEAD